MCEARKREIIKWTTVNEHDSYSKFLNITYFNFVSIFLLFFLAEKYTTIRIVFHLNQQ